MQNTETNSCQDLILREYLVSVTVCFFTKPSLKILNVSRGVGQFANKGHVINLTGEEEVTKNWL